ncbi:L,D-transpeptidase [Methylobacterium nonmethylotrophicum]|uniref:L,D-transpeptidase n=2 Tax=Methylobacterium nonmethylotrophicum TaxID=1141884 RepID=A0A4Z0NM61_9HYPH|nr:L,D-transpeptidase [Methylobacterium nonmethylotrophicum]
MRADGQRVYRCRSRPAATADAPRRVAASDAPAPAPTPLSLPDAPLRLAALPAEPARAPSVPSLALAPGIPIGLAALPAEPLPVPAAPSPPPPAASSLPALPSVKRGTVIGYPGAEAPGTIVVNTASRLLYLVRGDGTAIRYRVAVGRPGTTWKGVQTVTAKQEWPQWTPTPEMRRKRPGLPQTVAGGPRNPLGARALYLGSTLYRIHGTTDPSSIGRAASAGCFRMLNEDVMELYRFVPVGTKVMVI